MSGKSVSISLTELMEEEVRVLVESGDYASRSDVIRDAFRTFLRRNPEKRLRVAVELYRKGKVSLMRAAEIAEMDIETFREELEERGIVLETAGGTVGERKEVEEWL